MVSLELIRASNSKIATSLPAGLVAVFAGATSGIGETSVKQFAKHTVKPRIYFIGRTKESGKRVLAELKELNPEGDYTYISADLSLLANADDICRQIKEKETSINLLFLTTGTLLTGKDTPESLHYPLVITYYARTRLTLNLLPLLQHPSSAPLRRVVTVFAGTKEGPIDSSDFQARNVPFLSQRGHISSMLTLSLEALAAKAPEVSFVHDFPGAVQSNLGSDLKGWGFGVAKALYKVVAPLVTQDFAEAGERQVFFATSGRYPPAVSAEGSKEAGGVPLGEGVGVARGTDGESGSGVYSVNVDGESAGAKTERVLAQMREEGMVDKLWAHTEGEFVRVTGVMSI
ncbi:hypothetical protein B0T16DRAFT_460044 [Cercophora newfieldiana]|uniref:Short-chain dehydrogenases/reductase n=1 Tax=Cercophora newfieldiana TaxID=92897 RepID=A0AA39Y125_9PEZI|nr:hypothetical protein B0T16DRAFT_460044 [Cercophora newfieldiana]